MKQFFVCTWSTINLKLVFSLLLLGRIVGKEKGVKQIFKIDREQFTVKLNSSDTGRPGACEQKHVFETSTNNDKLWEL